MPPPLTVTLEEVTEVKRVAMIVVYIVLAVALFMSCNYALDHDPYLMGTDAHSERMQEFQRGGE